MSKTTGDWQDESFCYVTTTGRRTGKPHRIEIWFAAEGMTIYILAGGGEKADWVRNARANPSVPVEIGGRAFQGTARVPEDAAEIALARRLVPAKYADVEDGLEEWAETALPVAIDLE